MNNLAEMVSNISAIADGIRRRFNVTDKLDFHQMIDLLNNAIAINFNLLIQDQFVINVNPAVGRWQYE